MKPLALILASLAFWPSAPAFAQPKKKELRVFIAVDMEGIAGVVSPAQLDTGEFEYERFRKLMTAEVNEAIDAALAAGATKITVADSHGNGLSVLPEELNPKARLIRLWPRPLGMMEGIEGGFDAALLIGYHASAGSPNALLAHTFSSRRYQEVRFNGQRASEAMASAAIAGHFGVPVVLVTGDDRTIDEVRQTIDPAIGGVVVKRAIGLTSGDNLSPAEARRRIREETQAALRRVGTAKPFVLGKPIRLELVFKNLIHAEVVAFLPGVERIGGSTVAYTAADMPALVRFLSFLGAYNSNL